MPDATAHLTVTLLGTGTSTGVPIIGCDCRVCTSSDPRDNRRRTSALIEIRQPAGPLTLLIDTGPDFRQQALDHGIRRLDAVFFTHAHFDHIAGLDDLRPYFYENRSPLPCFARPSTAKELRRIYSYVFTDRTYAGAPRLDLREVSATFSVGSRYGGDACIEVLPIELFHGDRPILGYRIGPFAYLTDTSKIPEEAFHKLEGLDVLVLDALRRRPHPTHFSIDQAVSIARRIGARQTYFTHLTHEVLHAEESARLPEGIGLGYDGLTMRCKMGKQPILSKTASSER